MANISAGPRGMSSINLRVDITALSFIRLRRAGCRCERLPPFVCGSLADAYFFLRFHY